MTKEERKKKYGREYYIRNKERIIEKSKIWRETCTNRRVFRKMADKVFLNIMQENYFRHALRYYRAVRWFGWMFV